MKSLAIATIALLSAGAANAAITFTSAPFDAALAPGQTLKVTFDAPNAPGYVLTGTGAVYTGSTPGIAAAPAGDVSKYLAVLSGKTATLSTPLISAMSVYIGSIDTYNSIVFKGPDGFSKTFGGSALVASANGNQTAAGTNRRFYFDFGSQKINKIEFKSTGNSFEFDNIATAAAVPEPATWAMLITGFGLVGMSMRRRNRIATVSA